MTTTLPHLGFTHLGFTHLGLSDRLVSALTRTGISDPFPIQTAAIPDALAGKDISGKAPTGSGKTLAFGLPLLDRVGRANPGRPRALILAPTRELAEQIKAELTPLATSIDRRILAVYGGVSYGPQKNGLRRGTDVLVATPGRLEDLIEQGSLSLEEVEIVVIDEADKMADMGFLPSVRRIVSATRANRQTMLFSATLDREIEALSRQYQNKPVFHDAAVAEDRSGQVDHLFWRVDDQDRVGHVARLIERQGRAIAFTRTRRRADRFSKQLAQLGISSVALHGGRTQAQRNKALAAFSAGRVQALIATDVAARGIHVDSVATVIHVDLPEDAKAYLHRAGRTGRAGAEGTVVSLVAGHEEREVLRMQKHLQIRSPIVAPTGLPPVRSETPVNRTEKPKTPAASKHHGSQDKMIYVSNLPWEVTSDELGELFSRYGDVNQSTIVTQRNGRSRGFGFVGMHGPAAQKAIEGLDGSDLDGRLLTVRPARQPA